MSNEPRRRMSRWGIGPVFATLSLVYWAATCHVSQQWLPDLDMIWPPPTVGIAMAFLLIAGGLVVFVCGVRRINRAWAEDRLETQGIYAWVRHPIYSAFVVCFVPGVALLSRHVLYLTIPLFMYLLFNILIRQEERYLAERFGEAYRLWRARTSALLPTPPVPNDDP